MGRVLVKTWRYECDLEHASEIYRPVVSVTRGDVCSTGRGLLVVHDQADADEVVRQRGWTVGRRVLCDACAGGGL